MSQPEPITLFELTLDIPKADIITNFMHILESKLYEKFPMVDANYQRKVTDICANIK